jgi:hypothetical protein
VGGHTVVKGQAEGFQSGITQTFVDKALHSGALHTRVEIALK